MSVEELKKLLKNSTSVLVVDEGEPSFVIMSYQAYKDSVSKGEDKEVRVKNGAASLSSLLPRTNQREEELEILDRINKEILALKDEIEKEEKSIFLDLVE